MRRQIYRCRPSCLVFAVSLLILASTSHAQVELIENSDFEADSSSVPNDGDSVTGTPTGWTSSSAAGYYNPDTQYSGGVIPAPGSESVACFINGGGSVTQDVSGHTLTMGVNYTFSVVCGNPSGVVQPSATGSFETTGGTQLCGLSCAPDPSDGTFETRSCNYQETGSNVGQSVRVVLQATGTATDQSDWDEVSLMTPVELLSFSIE